MFTVLIIYDVLQDQPTEEGGENHTTTGKLQPFSCRGHSQSWTELLRRRHCSLTHTHTHTHTPGAAESEKRVMQAEGQDLLDGCLLGVGQAQLGKAAGHYRAHESRSAARDVFYRLARCSALTCMLGHGALFVLIHYRSESHHHSSGVSLHLRAGRMEGAVPNTRDACVWMERCALFTSIMLWGTRLQPAVWCCAGAINNSRADGSDDEEM